MKSITGYDNLHNYAAPYHFQEKRNKNENLINNRPEKYSLRQRQKRKNVLKTTIDQLEYNSDNSNTDQDQGDPFNFEENCSRKVVTSTSVSKIASKTKTKAAPLSKYRRKTANTRERARMQAINEKFRVLRQCVPQFIRGDDIGTTNEKLTKITTLRLAMKYIGMLTTALTDPNYDVNQILDHNENPKSLTNDYMSLSCSEEEINKGTDKTITKQMSKSKASSSPKTKCKKINGNLVQKPKRQTKKRQSLSACKAALNNSTDVPLTTTTSPKNPALTVTNVSQKLSHPLLAISSKGIPSDFNTLMLESDGESLHLSEHCLSPIQGSYCDFLAANFPTCFSNDSQETAIAELENPLESSFCLLGEESPVSSLDDFVNDHQPPSCISPLMSFEPLAPFSDLLHPNFSDNNSLDLFST